MPQLTTHDRRSPCHGQDLDLDLHATVFPEAHRVFGDMMANMQKSLALSKLMSPATKVSVAALVKEAAKNFIENYIGHMLALCGFGLLGDYRDDYIGWVVTLVFVFTLARFILFIVKYFFSFLYFLGSSSPT